MCKPLSEGGQRCAAHAKARLERKAVAMREVAERTELPGPERLAAFQTAREAWEAAAVDYASTPAGRQALLERQAAADAEGGAQTSAMLSTILQRGEATRAANEQIRAALSLGKFTESGLPDIVRTEVLAAPDENGHALSASDQQAWTALLDRVHLNAEESASRGGRMSQFHGDLKAADATIAAAASTDRDLGRACHTLTRTREMRPAFEPPRSSCDDYGDSGMRDWSMRHVTQGSEGLIDAQLQRALAHPNASGGTFHAVAPYLSPNITYRLPNCPTVTLTRINGKIAEEIDADTWQVLSARAERSAAAATVVALHSPNENAREDARLALSGAQWDTVPANELSYVRHHLPTVFCAENDRDTGRTVEESLTNWVRYFGDEQTQNSVLTYEERKAMSAAPALAPS